MLIANLNSLRYFLPCERSASAELFQAAAASLQRYAVKQLIQQKSAVISVIVLQKTSNFIQDIENYKLHTFEMLRGRH